MANKRTLKKNISRICGALAGDAILAGYFDNVDRSRIEDIVRRVAALQEVSRAKVSFWYDKAPRDFEGDLRAYHKARRAYFRAGFEKLRSEFNHEAISILKELNEAVPADVRQAVSDEQ